MNILKNIYKFFTENDELLYTGIYSIRHGELFLKSHMFYHEYYGMDRFKEKAVKPTIDFENIDAQSHMAKWRDSNTVIFTTYGSCYTYSGFVALTELFKSTDRLVLLSTNINCDYIELSKYALTGETPYEQIKKLDPELLIIKKIHGDTFPLWQSYLAGEHWTENEKEIN